MKILIAGDFCPRYRVKDAFDRCDFESVLGETRRITSESDYSIVNLECPVVNKKAIPIEKQGPNLCCSRSGIEAIKFAGFDCVTLANNHFYDYGEDGVLETISTLKNNCVDYVGGGKDIIEASRILYKEIQGQTLAIINCCEHEFSIATQSTGGSNPLNPIQQYYAIKEARNNADKVLVIVHGGHEHFQLPSLRMIETYHFFVDAGADAVINHHQHCFSGYEVYKDSPIFYGIGNFCFDNPFIHNDIWTEGFLVQLDFSSDKTRYLLFPYRQCDEDTRVTFIDNDAFRINLQKINSIISSPKELRDAINSYYSTSSSSLSNILEPIRNRYYLGAKRRGWLPTLIGRKRRLEAKNFIFCESHRDKLEFWFDNI